MHSIYLRTFIVATLILWHPFILFSQEEEFLSKKDIGYKYIEMIQHKACTTNPSINCFMPYDECKSTITNLWRSMFNENPNDSILSSMCHRVSTKYETRGVFNLLNNYSIDIQNAAKEIGVVLNHNIKLGSLPIREVNASTAPQKGNFYAVFINVDFMTFVNELSKLAANTLVFEIEGNNYTIDTSLTYFKNSLITNPSIKKDFIIRLAEFIEGKKLKPALPKEEIRPITSTFVRGIELFALAHEFAHVYLGHVESEENNIHMNDGTKIEAGGDYKNRNEWNQETLADVFALKIIKEINKADSRDTNNHFFQTALLNSPQFYFVAKSIFDEASSIIGLAPYSPISKDELTSLVNIKPHLQGSLLSIETVVKANTPRKRQYKHPHSQFRLKVANELLQIPTDTKENQIVSALCYALLRNTQLIWQETKPILIKTVKNNKK